MFSKFSKGAGFLIDGFRLLRHPQVLPFVIFPIVINTALFYFGFHYLTDIFDAWLNGYIDKIPDWLSFIETMLVWFIRIALLIFMAFSFTFAANLIGSPFYGLMAERVEAIKNPDIQLPPFNTKELIVLVPRAIIREIQKLLYYLLRAIPLLILSIIALFIAPLATITPLLWFMFGAFMLTIQYVDYAYDNHKLSFRVLAKDLQKDRLASLGFGAVCTLTAMVPLLNIIAIPAAACGGTVYFVERLQKQRLAKNKGATLDN